MVNYDFALDMGTDNSNSLILRNIKPGSKILEMGSAHGRMTKYLREQLNCEVFIVELNKGAGDVAAQYASASWIGKEQGDIENLTWFRALYENEQFDYIIFADVLEHLYNPDVVLQSASKLLKEDGSILISIPNLGYNGVMIDLLQDKFEYRDYGLLDKTHIKFFSHNSLKQFIATAGLTIVKENNAINTIENSEFKNTYGQLPKEVGDYMRKRKYGEVYQFIWELKKTEYNISIITPIFNKWAFTKNYLEDMMRLDAAQVEIIIVDNASTDETRKEIEAYKTKMPNLKVIYNDKNEGFGWASNMAYVNAAAPNILFLNNDIRVKTNHDNWIDKIIERCDDNSLISPTGGKVDPNNEYQFLYETNDPNKEINYLSGWCLGGSKKVFDRLIEETNTVKGPFSSVFYCYFEDTDLSFRAQQLGIQFKMIDIPVVHFGKVSSKQLNTYSLYSEAKKIFNTRWKHKLK